MKRVRGILAFGAALALPVLASPGRAAETPVPPDLEPWRGWVLHGEEFRRCPFFAMTAARDRGNFACTWPERLTLDLDARGGRFSQRWQLHDEAWVRLPGSMEHWPRDVQANGSRAAVTTHDGAPALRLAPGSYSITGTFRWERRPEALPVPPETGIVELILDGQRVGQPERSDGGVWLGKRRTTEEREHLEIQVYRLVQDAIPGELTTLVRLQVSGGGREELLAPVLPEGFVPLTLESELPARIEADGRLRVQVRAGSWSVTVTARAPGVIESLRRPRGEGPWVREEVWSFRPDDRLRVVAVEGASPIDPAQAGVPGEWRELPAYRMTPEDELRLVERSRGASQAEGNELVLRRQLWLDFDHAGYTALDSISGTMRERWRLDARAPQRLMSAQADEQNLLVTKGADETLTGIEIRMPEVDVTAVSRIARDGALSATGWEGRFASVSGMLHLPPGHRLLAASGADSAPNAWIERWRLLDMFLVLIVAAAAGRLFGWRIGALALLALVLVYHEARAFAWLWINVLVAYVLAREAPEGTLKRLASGYRNVSLAVLLLALVPFLFQQLRLALHPQLEQVVWIPVPVDMPREMHLEVSPPQAAAPRAKGEAGTPVDEITVTGSRVDSLGLNAEQVLQRYAPGTVVQAGPGVPSWTYNTYGFSWSGPVDSTQSVRFIVLSPWMLRIWRVAGSVLLAVLFAFLVSRSFSMPPSLPPWAKRFGIGGAAALGLATLLAVPAGNARADIPDAALLNQLEARLTEAPKCAPACGDVLHADLTARGDSLEIVLRASALAPIALPVPTAGGRWEPESISIDGQPNGALLRNAQSQLWVPLRPGTHEVRLSGRIAPVDSVQLQFVMKPHTIETRGEGWTFSGVSGGRLLTDSLEVVRERRADSAGRFDPGAPFPAFARVDRLLLLDLDWTVQTRVTRIAPERAALSMSVPLLPGESVLTPGAEVRGDAVLVGIPAGENSFEWRSGLARAERLELALEEGAPRRETWRFAVSPQWHVSFDGTPAILPADISGPWVFEFHPRPGEKLQVAVTRPQPAEGGTLAIDDVRLELDVGKRSTDATLELTYRSTQGGRHTIALPRDARVTEVLSDHEPVPLRPTDGELTFALLPGEHDLLVEWELPAGVALNTRAAPIDLRAPASNVTTIVNLPADRWALFAYGPGVGPAILLWGEIVVFVVLALLIGRSALSPLRTHEWLLLGLGLSTFSWSVLVVFAAWLFAMRWREHQPAAATPLRFNLRQVALAVLSVVALCALLAAVPNGLLGSPDMRVRTASGASGVFQWFVDQTTDVLPRPGVLSVSIWWYKAAMLAWALWLSFALIRWVPWAWRAWTKEGMWIKRSKTPPRPAGEQA